MARKKNTRRRSPPGSSPGHPIESVAADVAGASVAWLRYNETTLAEDPAIGLEEALMGLDPSAVDWIHVPAQPGAAALRWLHERLGLDPLALEDVHNGNQRTKFELYDKHSFMTISVPVLQDEELVLEQFSLFLGPHWVISFWSGDPALIEPVRLRVHNSGSGRIRRRGADYLFYCLVDSAVDAGFPVLEKLGDQVEALEDALLAKPGDEAASGVHGVRRKLAGMRRIVLPGQEALNRLLRSDDSPLGASTRRYVHDVLDHHVRIGEMIDSLAEVTRSLHELYLMSVSQRMNDVMRLLTIIATIFIPLTFIAGVYGMNFDPDASPWNMPELRSRYGYVVVMLLFGVIGLGMAWMFRRRGWF
jgi:magnesium transporter